MEFEAVIGLEVHVELKTRSKMFCGCPAEYFGQPPNSQTCPVCLGLPGALPVPNRKAVEWTILLGMALNCQINRQSKFDRKHYFYPDLPKGYQISQYDEPIARDGALKIKNQNSKIKIQAEKTIRIRRVHLEEDTGKLIHEKVDGEELTLVDFNRSGVPLVEIVTEPDFHSSEEAKEFLKKIQRIIRYLGISDADMEKGSMRIEPSISLRRLPESALRTHPDSGSHRETYPDYRVEVKNINSFRFTQKAIDFEVDRQVKLRENGEKIAQETRGWNEAKGQTVAQRTKEEAHDYRYFPEPDIPPMHFEQLTIDNLQVTIPELPDAKTERFVKDYGLRRSDADFLTESKKTADFFEELARLGTARGLMAQQVANVMINRPENLEGRSPKTIIEEIYSSRERAGGVAVEIVIEACRRVVTENTQVVKDYRAGKEKALDFLVGQTIRLLGEGGKSDPNLIKVNLLEMINHG